MPGFSTKMLKYIFEHDIILKNRQTRNNFMVKEIVRDMFFLSQPSVAAQTSDSSIADDLLDTLKANSERCVGLAANMIGAKKCILVFDDNGTYTEMFNPKIIKASGEYEAEEGCLSLDGVRKTKRFKTIKVEWQTRDGKPKIKTFSGFSAQIIQHEIDHFSGKII